MKKNKKLIILVSVLILGIGISLAYFVSSVVLSGSGSSTSVTTATIHGATLKVEGELTFTDYMYPGHQNISAIKLTATGDNEFIPYNLVWKGTNTLGTPLNYTVYKTSSPVDVSINCEPKTKVQNGAQYLTEECTSTNLSLLGSSISSGTINTSSNETTINLVDNEFITASPTGQVVYYYVVLEYPNLNSSQNTDIGGSFNGKVTVEESDATPDINILAVQLQTGEDSYTTSENIPASGYTLNTTKSVCNNDATPVWNSTTKKVDIQGVSKNGTSCYLYFDGIGPSLSITHTETASSITINATGTPVDGTTITNYYFSIDNGEFIDNGTTSSYTFTGLSAEIEYNIKVYAKNSNGFTSEVISETIMTGLSVSEIVAGATAGSTSITAASTTNEGIKSLSDGMYSGTTYYYRGAVNNNWVKFAGMYWRIIRFNGDGSIRMIYSGTTAPTSSTATVMTGTGTQATTKAFNSSYNDAIYVGFKYASSNGHGTSTWSTIADYLVGTGSGGWYSSSGLSSYASYIADGKFCNDRTTNGSYFSGYTSTTGYGTSNTAFAPATRVYTSSWEWNGTQTISTSCTNSSDIFTTKVGLITLDEVLMAGGTGGTNNTSYYLNTNQYYWTMSPLYCNAGHARVFYVSSSGSLGWNDVSSAYGVRPVINLKAGTKFKTTTNGTYSAPYEVM